MIGLHSTFRRYLVTTTLVALLGGCSGSGGGGSPDASPVIVTAAFVGDGTDPVVGDTLVLGFSTTIVLASDALFTDEDVTLSGDATLGQITVAPIALSNTTISITLGDGVSFTSNTTTIALSDLNDAIGGTNTAPAGGGTPITIGTSDGVNPTINNVTIAAIDNEMNGTGPAGGILQVPPNGWTIDLAYSDNGAIAVTQTVITANVAVSTSAGSQPPGTNLRPFLSTVTATNSAARYQVPTDVTFPQTPVELSCIIGDASGLLSNPSTFPITVRAFTNSLRPFETTANASQVWFLDFSRDQESYTTSSSLGTAQVDITMGANQVSDFDDLMLVVGLNTTLPISSVQPGLNSNEVVLARIKSQIINDLAGYYTGAPVTFTLTEPAGSFNGNSSVSYASLGFSKIAITGSSSTTGVLGLAIFDPSNTTQNDNTQLNFPPPNGTQRLGVFMHTIVDSGIGQNVASLFRLTYDAFTPVTGGTPIGDDPQDGDRLNGIITDTRATSIDTAITMMARFAATVTAHECGHSVGLVVNGAMPLGLYGNDNDNFPGSSSGHIRNTNLFPPGSTNLMSPALNFSLATSPSTTFNTLNMAYLREQVFYGN